MREQVLLVLCPLLLGSLAKASALDENIEVSGAVYVESTNYPSHYPNNEDREWTIQTKSEGYVIGLETTNFHLEYENDCFFDYVQVYDGQDDSAPFLGRWCGIIGPNTQSTGPSMFMKFHSDTQGTNFGFKLYVSAQKPSVYFNTSYVGSIIGAVISIILLFIIFGICCVFYRRRIKSNSTEQTPVNPNRINNGPDASYDNVLSTISFQGHIGSEPPPSYNEAVKHDPPPYCEVVSSSVIYPS